MKKNKLVSVVIPAYNVEKYISKCIDSILKQDYDNFEIIVVDDGSTDKTGKILDEISKKELNVKIYHKENSGVSSARNYGIEKSRGDYITFVDADDYLSEDFISYMMNLVNKTKSEFCLSENCFTQLDQPQCEDKIKIMDNTEATALLLSQRIIVGCWNKIYSKKLLDKEGIKFSEKLFYGEGLNFITTVSQKANSIAIGKRRVYYYRKNNNQSATTKFNVSKFYNGELSLKMIKDNLALNNSVINYQLDTHFCLFYINALIGIINSNNEKHYKEDYKYFLNNFLKYYKKTIKSDNLLFKQKIRIIIFRFFPKIIALLDKKLSMKISKKSV